MVDTLAMAISDADIEILGGLELWSIFSCVEEATDLLRCSHVSSEWRAQADAAIASTVYGGDLDEDLRASRALALRVASANQLVRRLLNVSRPA